MKLYTEEQVLKAIHKAMYLGHCNLEDLTPIELPSDEEIEKLIPKTDTLYETLGRIGMIIGAKWMRDKIQASNNKKQ